MSLLSVKTSRSATLEDWRLIFWRTTVLKNALMKKVAVSRVRDHVSSTECSDSIGEPFLFFQGLDARFLHGHVDLIDIEASL
jgi:hypothetical protein